MASIIECDDTPKRGAEERTETMATTVDPVEKKLDMSLDEIAEDRKVQPALLGSPPVAAGNASGKSRYTKRSDRLAQAGPYPPRMQRGNDVQYDGEGGTVPVVGRRVYVGNLSWSVQWQDLKDHMRAAGEVLYAAILESNGRSKGCGLVEFASEVEAARAIETLNDTELHGRKIFVREDRESNVPTPPGPVLGGVLPTPQQPPRSMTPSTRVYVGNLSWNVKWQDLKDHMKQAGNVMHADVLEEMNGRSKGCGLVEYSTPEEAQHAIATLNDTELEGRKIFVREDREPEGGSISSYARRGAAGPPRGPPRTHMHMPPVVRYPPLPPQSFPVPDGTSLYIGNLPWDVNWRSLKDLFRTVGEVDRAEVAQFPDGKSRGFGIVRFVYAEDAVRAIEQFNGFELNGRVIEVRYDKGRQEGPRP